MCVITSRLLLGEPASCAGEREPGQRKTSMTTLASASSRATFVGSVNSRGRSSDVQLSLNARSPRRPLTFSGYIDSEISN
jgi:hypothetical protein